MWWVIVIGCIVSVAAVVYLYLAITCFFTAVTFMTNYNVRRNRLGESHESALRGSMELFRYRHPFNILTDSDIDRLVEVFGICSDPHSLAQIWRRIDRQRDARQLKDQQFLTALETEFRKLREEEIDT